METPTRISQEDRVFGLFCSVLDCQDLDMLGTSEALGKYLLSQYWINEWDNFKKWVVNSDYIKEKEWGGKSSLVICSNSSPLRVKNSH